MRNEKREIERPAGSTVDSGQPIREGTWATWLEMDDATVHQRANNKKAGPAIRRLADNSLSLGSIGRLAFMMHGHRCAFTVESDCVVWEVLLVWG